MLTPSPSTWSQSMLPDKGRESFHAAPDTSGNFCGLILARPVLGHLLQGGTRDASNFLPRVLPTAKLSQPENNHHRFLLLKWQAS
eukprot:1602914-Amphidinium_carterae.2